MDQASSLKTALDKRLGVNYLQRRVVCLSQEKLITEREKNEITSKQGEERRESGVFRLLMKKDIATSVKMLEILKDSVFITKPNAAATNGKLPYLCSRTDNWGKTAINIENNWKGHPNILKIDCGPGDAIRVYCLQYDEHKIVAGCRDNTIKIWGRKSLKCTKVLRGHTGSVVCLQFDENFIISGSSDSTVRVWDLKTGNLLNTLVHHTQTVLGLKFKNGMMVTCSKDYRVVVWKIVSALEINLVRSLHRHKAAVNVVDFDRKYIVSASGDGAIKVWDTVTCNLVRTLKGHQSGIACMQYKDNLIVSGSADTTIRIWDIENGKCLRVLRGHVELVRCIRFDQQRIISGSYDGHIKVWDLQAALISRGPSASLCLRTLTNHTNKVLSVEFDEFQIISSGQDGKIIIWDFWKCRDQENSSGVPFTLSSFVTVCTTGGKTGNTTSECEDFENSSSGCEDDDSYSKPYMLPRSKCF